MMRQDKVVVYMDDSLAASRNIEDHFEILAEGQIFVVWLGLCSYFRRFIKNFSIIAKPLYDLLKKIGYFSLR